MLLLAACAIEAERPGKETGDPGESCAPSTWYADQDGDGFGSAATAFSSCEAPIGYLADGTDCEDADSSIHPGASEVCDGVDEDCDGAADDAAIDAPTWYPDADGDTFGNVDGATLAACTQPDGHVADATDCDDGDNTLFPGNAERCDGADENCNGEVDEGALDALTWNADVDGDGYGDDDAVTHACTQPEGSVAVGGDCDDTAAGVNPGADEHCDDIDEDCDGNVDELPLDPPTWYLDVDGDGYGTPAAKYTGCDAISGYAPYDTDCDDTDASISPGAFEVCAGPDEDCDGTLGEDDASDAPTWYTDIDGDGYGDAATARTACAQPKYSADNGDDCDDGDAGVSPGEPEYCGGGDEDCDGSIDESDAADAVVYYPDADGDGYGEAAGGTASCTEIGIVEGGDCDDADDRVAPGLEETCEDGIDQDCDGEDPSCITVPSGTFEDVDADFIVAAPSGSSLYTSHGDVAAVADLDGDTLPDLAAAGMPGAQGEVYLLAGPVTADVTLDASATRARFTGADGYVQVLGAGDDLDGDGFGEVLVRHYPTATSPWAVAVMAGSVSGDVALDGGGLAITWDSASAAGVVSVDSADWDGDGLDDLVASSAGTGAGEGAVAVVLGSLASDVDVAAEADWLVADTSTTADFGTEVSAGDLDADGYADLIVSEYSGAGADYTLRACGGGGSGSLTVAAACPDSVSGIEAHSYYGPAVTIDGDLDGNGIVDLVTSNYDVDSLTYAFFSPPSGAMTVASADVSITHSGAYAAGFHASAADIDEDGAAELLIAGIAGESSGTAWGHAVLYSGLSAGSYTTSAAAALYWPTYAGNFAWWAGITEDLTGGGARDVVVDGNDGGGAFQLYVFETE